MTEQTWLVLALGVATAGTVSLVAVQCEPLDGYDGWVLSHLAQKEDTMYAPQYTDAGFRRVVVGMTEEEVSSLVGTPLEVYSAEDDGKQLVGWRFSRSARGASYRIRAVLMGEGRVTKVFREFYLD
jgi:hypothetical protein